MLSKHAMLSTTACLSLLVNWVTHSSHTIATSALTEDVVTLKEKLGQPKRSPRNSDCDGFRRFAIANVARTPKALMLPSCSF